MQLTVTQENLTRALAAVNRVASSRAGLPILANILLRTEGNRLLVAATNLEIAATYYIGAKVSKQGEVTLPARLISEFVASLPKDQVELTAKGAHVSVTSGSYTSVINGVEADEFPELPAINEKESVSYTLKPSDFKEAVSQTIFTASSDTTRPVLTGVYWHSVDGHLYLAATDGYRLSERRLIETKSEIAAIVPASSLQEALRTLHDSVEAVEVLFDDTQVRFRIGDAEITSRLIDGNYPDYRQLIPKESETNITVKSSDFTRIVKVASLFARDIGGSVTLRANAEENKLEIHSIASELGENTSSADAEVTADGTITLNSRYITEALGAMSADTIIFRFSGKLSPSVMTAAEKDSDYIHIIMPLKS